MTTHQMNHTEFLTDFYGPTLLWFGPILIVMGICSMIGNLLLLWIGITMKSIRTLNGGLFVMSLAVSDFLYGFTTSALSVVAYFCVKNDMCPIVPKASGALSVMAVYSAIIWPSLVAMNRYLCIKKLPSRNNKLRYIASQKGTVLLTTLTWIYITTIIVVLLVFDAFGEGHFGIYEAKRFTDFWTYLVYLTSGVYAAFAYTLAYFYYHRLQRFVRKMLAPTGRKKLRELSRATKERRDTMSIMMMVKYTTLLAIATQGVAFFFGGGQWFLPVDSLPMWLRRVIYLSMSLPPVYNPWFSLLVLGPFKREIKRRYKSI